MFYTKQYKKWMNSKVVDEKMKKELTMIIDNDEEQKNRFSTMLDFGTAGLRGIMGAGLNNMNIYTVRYATQGLCDLILETGEGAAKKGVCIAYDSRISSEKFAWEAACTLSANGISVYIFDELRPTPELSFAIRELRAIAGINITASHNPKDYNGYKVYWEDGAQLPPVHAKKISDRLKQFDIFDDVKTISKEEAIEKGLVTIIGRDLDEKYMEKVLGESVGKQYTETVRDDFQIIYSPIHGAGYRIIPEVLKRLGIKHLLTVPEQMKPDGNFPTTKSPNPEEREALQIAIKLAEKEDVDLIIGTDPDADRVGIVIRNNDGEYVTLTGNQIGVLLLDYLIYSRKSNGTLKRNSVVIKSIVTTNMAKSIAVQNGVQLMDVLTGFKFIGEKLKEFEQTNKFSFIFGFEESNGYLVGTYARDKDAVVASMLIAEMACYYHTESMSLYDALGKLYEKYGYFDEQVVSITVNGINGAEKMKSLITSLRNNPPSSFSNISIEKIRDYQTGKVKNLHTNEEGDTGLPISDVLFYELEDGSDVVIRPSGTEPKLKVYIMVKAVSREAAVKKKEELVKYSKSLVEKMCENDIYI